MTRSFAGVAVAIGMAAAGSAVPGHMVSSQACAADLSPTAVRAAAPSSSWSGFYAGADLGAALAQRDATIVREMTGAALASGTTKAVGVIGGGHVGYNYQFAPTWLIGLEADASGSDLTTSSTGAAGLGQRDSRIDAVGTVRGRLGYVAGNWLLYGTGGFAWAHAGLTRTQQVGTINSAPPGTVETSSGFTTGWTAGAGAEWAFAPRWSARLEYLHVDLATQSFAFPLAGQRVDAAARIDLGRLGVSYRFD